jgi:hypothetical protein
MHRRISALLGWALGGALVLPAAAGAQAPCHSLCAPSFSFSPSLIRSHIFGGPRVRSLATGDERTLPAKSNLELIFSLAIPTAIHHFSLYANFQWLPTAEAAANPFTEYTAAELGTEDIRANLPSISLGVRYDVVPAAATGGWVAVTPYVSDLYSPAARPGARADYTHKLDVGVTTAVSPFAHQNSSGWLHGVGVFGVIDYVATGLPHAGDVLPAGEREFLTGARAASLIVGLSLPVAPLHPGS